MSPAGAGHGAPAARAKEANGVLVEGRRTRRRGASARCLAGLFAGLFAVVSCAAGQLTVPTSYPLRGPAVVRPLRVVPPPYVRPSPSAAASRAPAQPVPPAGPPPVAPNPSWQPAGRLVHGAFPLEVSYPALVGQPGSVAGLLRVDLARARLQLVPGTAEPAGAHGSGVIPQGAYPSLLAAFNGGFKSSAGYAGFVAGGHVYDAPQAGLGTIVVRTDGSVQIG
ncbi:MAG TPA: hypothetical protein VNE21_04265, partial [Mycobacteriales bacterium]|nr:hypothetical protein [Mycobacteriales bacterium]